MKLIYSLFVGLFLSQSLSAAEPISVWPDLAPGETEKLTGTKLPNRKGEVPPVTRVVKISKPTFTAHLAEKPNGTGILILPGGGFGKVVPDKEGYEAAKWLNPLGISVFVLSYRTNEDKSKPGWEAPLQDAQRSIKLLRANADKYKLKQNQIGLLGFSAGGQVAARYLSAQDQLSYKAIDDIDKISHRPDFSILIYPWNIYDSKSDHLVDGITVPKNCPPTFLAHTDDDRSSSLGSVLFYAGLKKHGISSELHVYGNGGHGYGVRPVADSQISSWMDHAGHWIQRHGF